jgi:hypothetical protein
MGSGDPIGSNRLAKMPLVPATPAGSDIVSRAASILAQEAWPAAARTLAASLGPAVASAPLSGPALAPLSGPASAPWSGPALAPLSGPALSPLSGPASAPLSGPAGLPTLEAAPDIDRLRRQAHDLIETFLAVLSPKGPPPDDRVPLLRAAAAVSAGNEARVTVKVVNEEDAPARVSLYSTNLVADAGYDIPSMRITCSPRSATIPPRGEAVFEVKIAVPAQAPAGFYSGLVQATGTLYVKAVISVEVK